MNFDNDFIKSMVKNKINEIYDPLNKVLSVISLILFVVSFFVKNFFIDLFKFVFLGLVIFRMFSKDRIKRSNENRIFVDLVTLRALRRKIEDDRDHVYRRCKKCKTILKLPLPMKRGILHAKCPNCKNRVTIFTLKKQKIEIIKKK